MPTHTILINNTSMPVIIRKHPRSRCMVIRYRPLQHHISLTLPRYVSIRQGLRFVEEKREWIVQQISENAKHVPFIDGQIIPVLGEHYTLCHKEGRGVVSIEGDCIVVPGDENFMQRRVLEWLKRQAKEEITKLAQHHAKRIGKRLKKISLRDTSSRWGSCSHDGNLSFSWRLVFAPHAILDYVVCHEVAHLKHHDHSAAFWAVVEALCPEHEKSREWLRVNGVLLYSYGQG